MGARFLTLNGDCRTQIGSPEWDEFLDGRKFDCVCTDPPYGIAFKSTFGKDPIAKEKYQQEIEDDQDVETAIATFDEAMTALAPYLADTCELYIFSKWTVEVEWHEYLRTQMPKFGIELFAKLIWENGYPGLGDLKYNWGCGFEDIYYLKRGLRPVPSRRVGVIHVDKVRPGTNVHPTQKPTELLKILLSYSCDPHSVVCDPFAGSGSTLVAAKELGLDSVGIEKDTEHGYFETMNERLRVGGLLDL